MASDTAGRLIVSLIAPWQPNIPPAWSPDGRLIAVTMAILKGKDSSCSSTARPGRRMRSPIPNGGTSGLGWLDPRSLVVNLAAQLGSPNQLFRLPYPAGQLTRLTNDPNDYIGVSLTSDGRSLVTGRQDARSDIWIGDGAASTGTEAVPPTSGQRSAPRMVGRSASLSAVAGGRPAILRASPSGGSRKRSSSTPSAPESRAMAAPSCSSPRRNDLSLWTADASGRRIAQLAPAATASSVVVTPDDRSVLYNSIAGGTVSIWMVPIEGGTPTKLTDGASVAVSPDGRSIAFTAQVPNGPPSLVVCDLPGCTSPRPIGAAQFDTAVAWTPDGRGVAYAHDGNLWVQPLGGGAPRQLTRFTPNRPIGSFALVARRQASGDHANDRHPRHRAAQGLEVARDAKATGIRGQSADRPRTERKPPAGASRGQVALHRRNHRDHRHGREVRVGREQHQQHRKTTRPGAVPPGRNAISQRVPLGGHTEDAQRWHAVTRIEAALTCRRAVPHRGARDREDDAVDADRQPSGKHAERDAGDEPDGDVSRQERGDDEVARSMKARPPQAADFAQQQRRRHREDHRQPHRDEVTRWRRRQRRRRHCAMPLVVRHRHRRVQPVGACQPGEARSSRPRWQRAAP